MATTSQRRAGILTMSIDSTNYDVVSDANYRLSTVNRESLTGLSGVQGYKEMPVTGMIKARIRDSGAISAQAFKDMTSVPVVMNLANGKSVSGNGMWNTQAVEVDPAEGTFDVQFEGVSVEESGASS